MLRVENEVLKVHPTVNFKRDFKASNIVTNVANVHKADEYFEVGSTAMVGNANNGKYIAKTEKRYKSKPVGELSISTVRRRLSPYVVTNATTSTTRSSSSTVQYCRPNTVQAVHVHYVVYCTVNIIYNLL